MFAAHRRSAPSASRLAVVAIAASLLLSACATPSPTPTKKSPSPSPTSTASPSPSSTPTAAATALPTTCEALVTPAALVRLTTGGNQFFPDFQEKISGEPSDLNRFVDYGGFLCQWGPPASDAGIALGFSPITAAQAATERARLTAEGWTASTAADGSEVWRNGVDELGNETVYIFEPGIWKFALDAAAIEYFAV